MCECGGDPEYCDNTSSAMDMDGDDDEDSDEDNDTSEECF